MSIKKKLTSLDDLTDEELQQVALELQRAKCKTDLYYLAKEVLGYSDMNDTIHRPLCSIVQSVNPVIEALRDKKVIPSSLQANLGSLGPWAKFDPLSKERLFNMFRGSFKTTIISISHTIQLMLLWPDIRILISSHKKEGGSGEILYAIKRHFISNKRFRRLFPDYCPTANTVGLIEWGTSERITLVNRSSSCAWPEATIEIAGLTTDTTGRHYDYIKNDDLVTRDSVTNETMLAKTREFKALQKFLFNQPEWGITDNVGTPYHFNDLYSNLRKSKGITKVLIPALNKGGNPTFPERFTKTGLEAIRNDPSMGSYEFSCQYQMNPVPPEDQCFRPEWLEREGFFYEPSELPKTLKTYVFVDPASQRRKGSDYTAIISLGVSVSGTIYLIDIIRDKLNPEARTNLAIATAKRRGIKKLHYETIGFQDTDKYIINRKVREQGYYIQVEEMKAQGKSKEDRISGLQPIYERGDIRWPSSYTYHSQYEQKNIDMVATLRDEMLMFPKCEHDDLLDAHSQFLQVTQVRPTESKAQPKDDAFMWWRQKAIDQYKPKKKLIGQFTNRKGHSIPARESWR